jgi:hypothetical protein
MASSTGPILAAGAITWANVTLFEGDDVSFDVPETVRIVVATGIASAGLSLLGKFSPDLAYGLSLAAILTVLVVPIGRTHQSPATRALEFVKF